jgi:hypothetical protein
MITLTKSGENVRQLMNTLNPARTYETADVEAFERLHGAELRDVLDQATRRFIAAKLGAKQ